MEEMRNPLPKRKPITKTQIGKELKEIYALSEGDEPIDMKTFDRAARTRRWPNYLIVAAALFIIAGVVWAGVVRFGGGVRYDNAVELAIVGPTAPRAGEVGAWTIRYKNPERLPLARAELTLRLPASITVTSTEPALTDDKSLTWQIGAVEPGGEGSVTVNGRVLDAVDSPIAVQGVLSYRPANFNADFQKIATWSSRIADAAIEAKFEAPEEAVPGDDETFKVTVEKRADLSELAGLPGLKIRFDPDRAIVVKKAEPAFSSADERTWIAPPPDERPLEFTVTGGFTANAAGDTAVRVEVGTLNDNGEFILLAPAAAAVKVLPGDLVLTLIRNGSTADAAVDLGAALHISVDYENKSQKTIGNAEIALTVAGAPTAGGAGPIDWSTLDDLRGGRRSGNTITWTKNEVPELARIEAGAKGSVDISVKTNADVFTTADRKYSIDLSARGSIGSLGGKKSNKTVSTPVINTLLNSDARLAAAAAPLSEQAPKAGQTASYRVVWALSNSLHEITGIKVAALVPAGVSFAGSGNVTAGDLRYDDGTRAVTWTLNRLPTSIKSVSVDFTVAITPGNNDIGKTLRLLEDSIFTATDKDTGASLVGDAAPLDTATDASDGIVQP